MKLFLAVTVACLVSFSIVADEAFSQDDTGIVIDNKEGQRGIIVVDNKDSVENKEGESAIVIAEQDMDVPSDSKEGESAIVIAEQDMDVPSDSKGIVAPSDTKGIIVIDGRDKEDIDNKEALGGAINPDNG